MDFKGKTALVTGSSGGIGAAVAIAFAKEGADIILASRNMTNMQSVKKEIEALAEEQQPSSAMSLVMKVY